MWISKETRSKSSGALSRKNKTSRNVFFVFARINSLRNEHSFSFCLCMCIFSNCRSKQNRRNTLKALSLICTKKAYDVVVVIVHKIDRNLVPLFSSFLIFFFFFIITSLSNTTISKPVCTQTPTPKSENNIFFSIDFTLKTNLLYFEPFISHSDFTRRSESGVHPHKTKE